MVVKSGFTLLELLAVMLIIGLLAGLGIGGYSLARHSAKEGRAKADIERLRNGLEEYRVQYGAYPSTADGLLSITNHVGARFEVLDPWGQPYQYVSSNRFQYSIFSLGVDAQDDADNIDPSRVGY